ncbi:MAG: radical SAM protein [Syntrophomonadaceae bacterium]
MTSKVVLVYPYFRRKDPVAKLFHPLGIAYLQSQLKALGVDVAVVDCTFETLEEALAKIVSHQPAIVGISTMVSLSRTALDMAIQLKNSLPQALLVTGGPLPTVYPERFLSYFDLVFQGEADLNFPRFCLDYLAADDRQRMIGGIDVRDFPGICLQRGGKVLSSRPVHHATELINRLPMPDRSGFPHERYQEHWAASEQIRPATLMVNRGCPYSCDFCSKPIWGNLFRKPDLVNVFMEIQDIISLGYDRLWIADDSFTLDLDYLQEFCRQKRRRGLEIDWTCLSRTRGIDERTVNLMKEAGCVKVYLGLESGSDSTLSLMQKSSTVQDGLNAVTRFAQAGIKAAGFFMVGYPGETTQDIEKTFAHAMNLPLDEISFNVPLPLPGSALYTRVCHLNPDDDWDRASEARFVYDSEFDQEWLQGRIKETLAAFKAKNKNQPAD